MSREMNEDKLDRVDFASLYSEVPEDVHAAVELARANIRRYERRRALWRRAGLYAAAALVVLAGVAAALRPWANGRNSDVVAPPVYAGGEDPAEVQVYASKADPYYHRDPDCPAIDTEVVALPLITAQGFEKTPCPRCGG